MPRNRSDRPAARLVLEDGTVFNGLAFGACREQIDSTGEVVFNTAMSGYQEALTDPSYAGQILTMTASQIGNYGICLEDSESARPHVAGFVIRELARLRSNQRSFTDLSDWLEEAGVLGIERIDTRALVRRLRVGGAKRGVITCDPGPTDAELVQIATDSPVMTGRNLAAGVSPSEPYVWMDRSVVSLSAIRGDSPGIGDRRELRVAALDCGAKRNIYRHLTGRGFTVNALPFDASAQQVLETEPDGVFISNGPGDPAAVETAIATLRQLIDREEPPPTFGICLGHQLLALALGAETFKLKFGHRGANQPVRNRLTGSVEITSQNHGFCVDGDSLEQVGCEITHVHLNDGTPAGFRHRSKPIYGVQYHPEASPGPHDSEYVFDSFVQMMRSKSSAAASIAE